MSAAVLYDALGPRGRRRVLIASIVSSVLLGLLLVLALSRFASRGQLDEARWRPFTFWSTWRFLLVGLRNTVAATAVAGSLAMAAGLGLALLRLSGRRVIRVPTGVWIQFFRGVPLLLLIFFLARFFGQRGIDLSAFWILVLGLTVYNAAVLAEVFRAGILSLDRGQREAAAAIGLRPGQAMRLVVLPQAVRRMLPTLVSQVVILLKDTSLGFVLPYAELLRRGRSIGEVYPASILQSLLVVAALYLCVNVALSRVAARLERRQSRRFGQVWKPVEQAGAAAELGG